MSPTINVSFKANKYIASQTRRSFHLCPHLFYHGNRNIASKPAGFVSATPLQLFLLNKLSQVQIATTRNRNTNMWLLQKLVEILFNNFHQFQISQETHNRNTEAQGYSSTTAKSNRRTNGRTSFVLDFFFGSFHLHQGKRNIASKPAGFVSATPLQLFLLNKLCKFKLRLRRNRNTYMWLLQKLVEIYIY